MVLDKESQLKVVEEKGEKGAVEEEEEEAPKIRDWIRESNRDWKSDLTVWLRYPYY